MAGLLTLLHFEDCFDTSGYFPELARWHDRGRYRMLFGTLRPMDPSLRSYMESQGVSCLSLDCRGRRDFPGAIARLTRTLREQHVGILHTHLFEPSLVGLAAGALAGTPVRVVTRHYSDYHTRIRRHWHTRLDKLCTRLADGVVAVSRHTAEHLILIEGAPPAKVHVILNGVQLERAQPSRDAETRVRRELDAPNEKLLLVPARLHPEKGQEHLFRCLPLLKATTQGRFLILVAGDGPFAEPYRRLVHQLGCDDVVRFLGFRRDLPDLMAAAYAVVLPSVAEAFGIVLVEALHIGVPVVATRVGGIPEIVDDGRDGVLVPPADSAALGEALRALLVDPAARERLVGAGREKVARAFSFERMVREYESLYARLVASARSGGRAASSGTPGLPRDFR